MKKILSVLLSIIVAFGLFSTVFVFADNEPTAQVSRVIAFGDSVVYGDSNSGYGSGNKFGEEHFINLLGKEYSLNRITKTSDATANGKWFINLAKCGYTIGDKSYWETTRAPGTYNGTIYEDEIMACDTTVLANADTIVLDGGVNDLCRLAGWLASASYSGTYTGSEKIAAYNVAPGETKTISAMTAEEALAYAEKYKNLKGDAFEEFKTTYESNLTSAVRSWEQFRNVEITYLTNIVTYLDSCGFDGNIYFMDNPNSFIEKNTGLGVFWDEMLSYCQSEPMEIVAGQYSNVYHAKVTENVRDAKKYMSSSTDYLHLSFLGNREIYKVISKTVDPNANTLVFEDNTLPDNASWKTLYDFESYDVDNTTFKYITGGTIKNESDITVTVNNSDANSTKVLYKPSSVNSISISREAFPQNTYGVRVKAFTEGTSSFVTVKVFSDTRDLTKSSRTNTGRWGEFSFLPGYTAANCANSSVSGLGTLINISDMSDMDRVAIYSSLNSSQEPCYIEKIEVYTTDDVIVNNEDGATNPTNPTEPTEPTEPTTQPIDTNIEMTTQVGASIRLNNRSGLRFYTGVDQDKVLQLKNAGYTVELGTLIAPYDYLGASDLNFDLASSRYVDVKYTSNEYFEEGTFSGIVGSIVNIKESTTQNQKSGNILRYFVARGYAKITDSKNNTTIVYADYTKASPRSLGYVAYMFKNDNQNNALYLANAEKVDKWVSLYEGSIDPNEDDIWG